MSAIVSFMSDIPKERYERAFRNAKREKEDREDFKKWMQEVQADPIQSNKQILTNDTNDDIPTTV